MRCWVPIAVVVAGCARPDDASPDACRRADAAEGATVDVTSLPAARDPATVGALRLIRPISTSIVTSRRPTLRWGPMPPGARALVSLCDDPACARTLATLDVDAASARPRDPLRPGPVFWRVRVLQGGGAPWESPTWEFFVRPRELPVDAARCCVTDVNRDGVPDVEGAHLGRATTSTSDFIAPERWSTGVLVSAGGTYGAQVRAPGYARPRPGRPTCRGPELLRYDANSVGLRYVGDVDGDGFGDLADVIRGYWTCGPSTHWSNYVANWIELVGGGADGFSPREGVFGGWAGVQIAPPLLEAGVTGDVDGDGYAEVSVSGPPPPGPGYVNLYAGGTEGVRRIEGILPERWWENWFVPYAFGFDADGDARTDVASLEFDRDWAVRFTVTTGRARTTWSWAGPRFDGPPDGRVERAGDVDGDGYEELATSFTVLAGAPRRVAMLLCGGPSGYSLDRTLPAEAPWYLGGVGSPLFDVNGDGATDRLGGPGDVPTLLYYGGPQGYVRSAPLPHCGGGAPPGAPCGDYRHFSVGDFTRDGYDDLWVWHAPSRTLQVFAGGPGGLSTTPVATIAVAE